MRTSLRKIGNSRGILIPAALLAACEISDTVEMRVDRNRIIIEPVALLPRQGWFESYKAEKDSEALADMQKTAVKQDDWEW